MKHYGSINHPKDLVNKEYVDNNFPKVFVKSSTPPDAHNIFWVDNSGVWRYYDPEYKSWFEFGGA